MIDEIRDVTGTQPVPLHVLPQGDAMKDLCLHGDSLPQGLERDDPKTTSEFTSDSTTARPYGRTAGKQHQAIEDLAARLASLPPEAIAALQALFGGPPERPKNSE